MRTFLVVNGVALFLSLPTIAATQETPSPDDVDDPFVDFMLTRLSPSENPESASEPPSVLDQMVIADYLANAGIDREQYGLAGAIAQRLAREGIDPAELSRLGTADIETRMTYRMIGIVLITILLLFAAWRRFAVHAAKQ